MDKFNLNSEYETILSQIKVLEYDEIISKLFDTLPVLWTRIYNNLSPRISNICVVSHDSFHYIFDIGPIDEDDFANSPIYYEPRIVLHMGFPNLKNLKEMMTD